jgi:hypothetical protein
MAWSTNKRSLGHICAQVIAGSGCGSPGCGSAGNGLWQSSNLEPSLPGRRNDSEITGEGSARAASLADLSLPKKSGSSSRICGSPIPPGAHLALSGNCKSWAFMWPNPRWRNISQRGANHRPRHGKPSWQTTHRTWWPSISSPCRP